MKKNVASQVVGAQLINKADGTPCTTGTTTAYVLGDGGTQGAGSVGSGACTHEGNGFWTYTPSQAETNYDHVAFTFVNTTAVNATVQIWPSFPQTGDNYARLGAPAGASVSADIATVSGYVDTEVAAIKAKTDNLPSDPADASDIADAFTTVNGTLTTIAGYIDTEVAAIKAKTDNLPASPAATSDIPSASSIASAVWSSVIEGSTTALQMVRGFAAALLGKASGMATTTATFRDTGDTKDRITATVDADGNRSAVTLDLT